MHLRRTLHPLPHERMRDMLDRQSAAYEQRLDKAPWTPAKMTLAALDRMMRQILPFRLEVAEVQGTWKLAQNKPDHARRAAADQMRQGGFGHGLYRLADLMEAPPKA